MRWAARHVRTVTAGGAGAGGSRSLTEHEHDGGDPDVVLVGGAATVRSALDAGLLDALTLHLAPVVLGAGTPLFTGQVPRTLVRRGVTPT
ncbi:dihydrofolate reductase family protein [Streptomyces sp. MBT51]|nr:dihydrofolate reductase family protein [Streptomyces sp. MBT51]